jgi:hypothetical protein
MAKESKPVNPFPASSFDFEARPLSYSSLKHILRSPLHFSNYRTQPKKKTAALIQGDVTDGYLFIDEKTFKNKYGVMPSFTGTGSKAAKEEFLKNNPGVNWVKQEVMDNAIAMGDMVKTNPKSAWLYEATTEVQKRLTWRDPKTGLPLIGYLDAVAEKDGKPVLWDLKTTTDASGDKYARDADNFAYWLQAYAYIYAYARKTGIFCDFYQIVVESSAPYAVNTFRCSSDFIELGKQQYRKALDRVKFCIDNDCFNAGYDFMDFTGYDELDLPYYTKKRLD